MSHPKTLPPPRMKGYNGGLLSKATGIVSGDHKDSWRSSYCPNKSLLQGSSIAMMALLIPSRKEASVRKAPQASSSVSPFLSSIAFFLEVQMSQNCQAFDESSANARSKAKIKTHREKRSQR